MFGFIPFIESFFLLSLGITFILIFLMVFHFKQRIEKLEKKNNNLSDLSNKIVKEITNLHSVYLQNQSQNIQRNFVNPKEHICENIRITTSIPIPDFENENNKPYKKIVVMDTIVDDEYMTDSEYEYDEDSELDSETESICIEEVLELELEPKKEEIHLIKLSKESVVDQIFDDLVNEERETIIVNKEEKVEEKVEEKEVEKEEVEEVEVEVEVEAEVEKEEEKVKNNNNNQTNYQKMNISKLRILAISRGLCSDTSKIKRPDLIKLLESEI